MQTRSHSQVLNLIWLALMAMTIGSALIAESGDATLLTTLIVAATVGLKGRLVVERFMELRNARPWIRFAMNFYFLALPVVMLAVWLFPDVLADLTRLSDASG